MINLFFRKYNKRFLLCFSLVNFGIKFEDRVKYTVIFLFFFPIISKNIYFVITIFRFQCSRKKRESYLINNGQILHQQKNIKIYKFIKKMKKKLNYNNCIIKKIYSPFYILLKINIIFLTFIN